MPVSPPTTAEIIVYAEIAQVLADRDNQLTDSFNTGYVDKTAGVILSMESDILDWVNTNDPNNADLSKMANYVLGLCGQFIIEAQQALNPGSGIIITPTTGQPVNLIRYRADFTIGQAGALMNAGDSTLVINLRGFVIAFLEPAGIDMTIGDNTQASLNSITYAADSVTFSLNQPVTTGERYIVWGLRAPQGTTNNSGGGSGIADQTGHEGEVMFTDGVNTYWGDVIIDVASANFELDGITVLNTNMRHNQLDIYYNEGGRFLTADEFTRISGGGFTINILGWDANVNSYTLKVILRGLNS